MQQIVDLHADQEFQGLKIGLVSIAFDSPAEQRAGTVEYGIEGVPMASDADGKVSGAYGVLKWAVATGEPGHTFVLVDEAGKIAWIRDYGAAESGGEMYVPPADLVAQIRSSLK